MFVLRYLVTFAAEIWESRKERHNIQVLGHKKGSWSAWMAWCHTTASYCARYRHPLRLCWDREAWIAWMSQDEEGTLS